jgi:hypothetical protein
MTLWLRRTEFASPPDANRADYLVIEHDKVIGRIYEDRQLRPSTDGSGPSPSTLIQRSALLQTAACPASRKRRAGLSRVGVRWLRRLSKKNNSRKLREWRVVLMRYPGELLGYVKAASREAAESEAARLFSLSDFHRRRLLLQERV